MHLKCSWSCLRQWSRDHETSLPQRIPLVKNRKQKLHNDLIDYSERNNKIYGMHTKLLQRVRSLCCDLLIYCGSYINGHYEGFKNHFNTIPPSISQLLGYNIPEALKHCKWSLQNTSAPILREYANNILKCLQGFYWLTNPNFMEIVEGWLLGAHYVSFRSCYLLKWAKWDSKKSSFSLSSSIYDIWLYSTSTTTFH